MDKYDRDGFFLEEDVFSSVEIDKMVSKVDEYMGQNHPGIVFEDDGKTVRGVHGCHLYHRFFKNLVRDSRIGQLARDLLGGDIYVHQFKINFKRGLDGEKWPWHQDFVYWRNEDFMPAPNILSVGIFLDDVTPFNGPITFIRGSHTKEMMDQTLQAEADADWNSMVIENLKYVLSKSVLRNLCQSPEDMVAPTGKRGSVLFFHPCVAHCSASNMDFYDRRMIIISYNRTTNAPKLENLKRPEFMGSRDFTPLVLV